MKKNEEPPPGGERRGLEIPLRLRGYPRGSDRVYRIQYDPGYFLFPGEAQVPIATLWPALVLQALDMQILQSHC